MKKRLIIIGLVISVLLNFVLAFNCYMLDNKHKEDNREGFSYECSLAREYLSYDSEIEYRKAVSHLYSAFNYLIKFDTDRNRMLFNTLWSYCTFYPEIAKVEIANIQDILSKAMNATSTGISQSKALENMDNVYVYLEELLNRMGASI